MFAKGLILVLTVAVALLAASWLGVRHELHVVNAANESLRKALGAMAIAMAQKNREIDRLAGLPCDPQKTLQPRPVTVSPLPLAPR